VSSTISSAPVMEAELFSIRRANERGHANHGWVDTYHTFSFAGYYDPKHMCSRALRVINDDTVAPGKGFGTHGHRDMEIITYMLDGALEHRDSTGSVSVLRPGDVQRMSAGTGVTHSEFNHSKEEPLHLLQIWLLPEREGLSPGYDERHFSKKDKQDRLRLIVSPDGAGGSLQIHQDARVYAAVLSEGIAVQHILEPGRHSWVQVASGSVSVNGHRLDAGDGASISGTPHLNFDGNDGEFLLFDLA